MRTSWAYGNICSVRVYSFTVAEHDPAKPWLVVWTERRTVKLENDQDFHRWADERWPRSRLTVQLDPRLEAWRMS